ncbi:MAG: hypothetical protein GY817_04240 [bacterium]|nr:hypothetical protein [bacterium]
MRKSDNINIFISAGDYSGDMHAGYLVQELKKYNPKIKVAAIGGIFLETNKSINFLVNIVKKQAFVYEDLFKQYFFFKNLLNKQIIPYLEDNSVKLVILVDFYGFNIHLAKRAKKLGIKVIHYISPQVWASRKNRLFKIKRFTDLVIPILPFEAKIYEEIGVQTFYAGNPLIDIVDKSLGDDFNLEKDCAIALMPGSRMKEIKNILPIFLEILERDDIETFLIVPKTVDLSFVKKMIIGRKIKIIEGPAYALRSKVRFILTSSGTATLENALLKTPMLIFYKLDRFSYFIAKLIAKIKYIGMPNILAGKEIMPEYIQNIDYTKAKQTFNFWLNDDNIIAEKQNELKKIIKGLKSREGSVLKNIAEYIGGFIKN